MNIDLKIFLNKDIDCKNDSGSTECTAVQRVIAGLAYYQILNKNAKTENSNGQSIFSELLLEGYSHYLDDITHLMVTHDSDLSEMNSLLLAQTGVSICSDINQCLLSDRHCQIKDGKNGNICANKNDLLSSFHEQTWDNIHFYLLHLFDIGLRQRDTQNESEMKSEEMKESEEKPYFERRFKEQRQMIEKKRRTFPRFSSRFEPVSNKFVIQTIKQTHKLTNDDETFVDSVFGLLQFIEDVTVKEMQTVYSFITAEEYDTDAMTEDVKEMKSSNILGAIKDTQLKKILYEHIQQKTLSATVFSTGFTWFYWKYFGDKTQKRRVHDAQNRNDYGGYTQFELYIKTAKYSNLKEEFLNNEDSDVGINEYEAILVKAQQYMTTQRVRAMKAEKRYKYGVSDDIINYEIEEGTPLTISHLKSALFYTDFSKLSTLFTRTFRRIFAGEALESVKQRNRSYWHMSKLLIEFVNCFGTSGDTVQSDNGETGPFFTGMSVVIAVPTFRIRLCGPTSTTKEILVSQNFAKDNGSILELDNQSDLWTRHLKFLDVSWCSKFKEENERIFVHGQWPIAIRSIRLTKDWSNFGTFFAILTKFDAAISGGTYGTVKSFSAKNGVLIRKLFTEDCRLPAYISDTWRMFRFHKKTIQINLDTLINSYPSALQDLLLENVGGKHVEWSKEVKEFEDNTNLLRSDLVDLFPTLTEIVLECSDWTGEYSYQFSLFGILDILTKRRRNKVKISLFAVWRDCIKEEGSDRRSWLFYLFEQISPELEKRYRKIAIKMEMKQIKTEDGRKKDLLVFC